MDNSLKIILEDIRTATRDFEYHVEDYLRRETNTAARKSRKASLELRKLLKEYKKLSSAATK